MSTPKPGQIRCPTCLRSTPPAAFCTQCGSPIPQSARARPRGLDREELEERVRRRPGEGGGFRRGASADGPGAYVPFEREPEDALAARADEREAHRNVDNLPSQPDPGEAAPGPPPRDPDLTRPIDQPVSRSWAADESPSAAAPPPPPAPREPEPEPEPSWEPEPDSAEPAYRYEEIAEDRSPYPPEAYEDVPYGRPEDAYAYPYTQDDGRGGGGGSALPIIGFVVLCVLALAVGAVLAGLLGGEEPVGQATPSASVPASQAPSQAPSELPSQAPSASAGESSPTPTDGPITFADGAVLTIQPCGSGEWRNEAVGRPEEDACEVDGSSVSDGQVWAFVVFNGASGSDELRLRLLQNDQVENELELTIDSALGNCGDTCNGLIYGARYVELLPGDYRLELHRNGEFADSATFEVTG